jgi:hypothetical protein
VADTLWDPSMPSPARQGLASRLVGSEDRAEGKGGKGKEREGLGGEESGGTV